MKTRNGNQEAKINTMLVGIFVLLLVASFYGLGQKPSTNPIVKLVKK